MTAGDLHGYRGSLRNPHTLKMVFAQVENSYYYLTRYNSSGDFLAFYESGDGHIAVISDQHFWMNASSYFSVYNAPRGRERALYHSVAIHSKISHTFGLLDISCERACEEKAWISQRVGSSAWM